MKRNFLLGAALMLGLGFAACKKDYTCECTVSVSGPNGTTSTTTSSTINDTKKNAEAACDEGDATSSGGGYTSTTSCTIK